MHKFVKPFIILVINFTIFVIAKGSYSGECNATFINNWRKNTVGHTSYIHKVPYKNIIIHHTMGIRCYNSKLCSTIVRNIEDYSMANGCHDIKFNFLIGDDGNIYTSEHTFYNYAGCHTLHYDNDSIGIAFIGDFNDQLPNDKSIELMKNIIDCGLNFGHISQNYNIYGARTLNSKTKSPGIALFNKLKLINPQHFKTIFKE